METIIYLVRHGETDSNRERRFQGQIDIPLNRYGEFQATNLAKRLYDEKTKIDAIYSSDLIRAKATAETIADIYNLKVNIDNNLRERSFGKLEGLEVNEVKSLYSDFDILMCKELNSYGIETLDSLKTRVLNSILKLSKNHLDDSILIVSHGAAINSLLQEISQDKLTKRYLKLLNTSISTIIYNHKKSEWKIIKINDAAHIEGRGKNGC